MVAWFGTPALLAALLAALWVVWLAALPAAGRQLNFVGTAETADVYDLRGLAFSPDGRHAYTMGDDAAVFEVEESGGEVRLIFVENIEAPDYTYSDEQEIVVSADGSKVFVYRNLYGGGAASGLSPHEELLVYRRHPASGRLTLLEGHHLARRAFALSPNGTRLYLVESGFFAAETDSVRAYRVGTHGLDLLWDLGAEELTGGLLGGGTTHLQLDATGEHLYVLFPEGNSIGVFRMDTAADAAPQLEQLLRIDDVDPGLAGLTDLIVTSDGRQVVASDGGPYSTPAGGLLALDRDPSTGQLSLGGFLPPPSTGGDHPGRIVPSPDGRFLVTLWTNDVGGDQQLTVHERGVVGADLVLRQTLSLEVFGEVDEPRFSPSGDVLLLPFYGGLWSVAWTDGELAGEPQPVEVVDPGYRQIVRPVAVHPGGTWVYSTDFGTMAIYRRLASGSLRFETTVDEEIDRVVLSSDGRHLYGTDGGLIKVFEIDPATGMPTLTHTLSAGDSGEPGTYLPRKALSADGRWLVAAGLKTVALFERDPSDGSLTWRDQIFDGDDGVTLFGTAALAISPDSRSVYAALDVQNSVVAFDLDPATGTLTYLESVQDRLNETDYELLLSAAVTSDGRHLVVGGNQRLLVYGRESATGRLDLVQVIPSLVARSLVVDPDGDRVFVHHDGRLTLHLRDEGTGRLEPLETLDNREVGVHGLGSVAALDPAGRTLYSSGAPGRLAVVDVASDGPCVPGIDRLCLGDQRFEVTATWRDARGRSGTARAATVRTKESGVLWFFSEDNWEMQVKVLDACNFNDRFWVFAASATTLETTLKVTDRLTGDSRTYTSPLGQPSAAVTDTDAFSGCGPQGSSRRVDGAPVEMGLSGGAQDVISTHGPSETGACVETPTVACLGPNEIGNLRFAVEVEWLDGAGRSGLGRVAPGGTRDSALFWFFGPDNWELLVKVLDGCSLNGHHWVLSAAATSVGYTLRVTDRQTGEVREYVNARGQSAPAVADVTAFGACP